MRGRQVFWRFGDRLFKLSCRHLHFIKLVFDLYFVLGWLLSFSDRCKLMPRLHCGVVLRYCGTLGRLGSMFGGYVFGGIGKRLHILLDWDVHGYDRLDQLYQLRLWNNIKLGRFKLFNKRHRM
jgi:hypothetical protein